LAKTAVIAPDCEAEQCCTRRSQKACITNTSSQSNVNFLAQRHEPELLLCSIRLIQTNTPDATKIALWNTFASGHRIPQGSVPLFHIRNGGVTLIPYGRDNHLVLKRAQQMETKMRV
jgi:hypothetical protein